MSLLGKLKSILGRGGSPEDERDVTVTVEHDPQNEAAVKGTDAGAASAEDAAGRGDVGQAGEDTGGFEFGDAEAESESSADESSLESAAIEEPGEGADDADTEESTEPDEDTTADEPAVSEAEPEDEAEPESEDEAAGSEGASDPVDALSGIGSAYAERLGEAGIETVADLADADAGEVAEETGIAEGRVSGWIDQARDY